MFDTLLSLPLFQGLSHDDLTRILESTHLSFDTLPPESVITRQDELCTGLTYVLSGEVEGLTEAADRSWNVVETMPTPLVLGLDVLYGRARVHQFSAYARTSTRLLTIDKHTVAALTGYFEVFRINVLNALTTAIAQQRQPLWTPAATTLEGRIVEFLRQHVHRPAGHKIFRISMRTLGAYLGEDQRYVSMAAHRIERRGLIQLRRSAIQVPAFESLIQAKL